MPTTAPRLNQKNMRRLLPGQKLLLIQRTKPAVHQRFVEDVDRVRARRAQKRTSSVIQTSPHRYKRGAGWGFDPARCFPSLRLAG